MLISVLRREGGHTALKGSRQAALLRDFSEPSELVCIENPEAGSSSQT